MIKEESESMMGKLLMQDTVLSYLRSARQYVDALKPRTEGNDLELVSKALEDAVVTFAGTMTLHGLPEEVNRILRSEGFGDLVDR